MALLSKLGYRRREPNVTRIDNSFIKSRRVEVAGGGGG